MSVPEGGWPMPDVQEVLGEPAARGPSLQTAPIVIQHPESWEGVPTHYCPGCGHGLIHRLVANALDELGIRERTVGVAGVGCAILIYNYLDVDFQELPHGRAPAGPRASSACGPTLPCSPIRATAIWRPSARPRSCTRPRARRTSP